MLSQEFTIVNKLGLHARAAAVFVQLAGTFSSEVEIFKESLKVNGKSIMGVLMLAAACGSQIKLEISGDDEQQAMSALGELIKDGFGELEGD